MRKLIVIGLLLYIGLQSNISMCTQGPQETQKPKEQSWREWFWSKLSRSAPDSIKKAFEEKALMEQSVKQRMTQTFGGVGAGLGLGLAADTGIKMMRDYFGGLTLPLDFYIFYTKIGLSGMSPGIAFLSLALILVEIRNYATKRTQQVIINQKIKQYLIDFISNTTLFPTRSSKINALLKKDEFQAYVILYAPGFATILDNICNEIIEEIVEKTKDLYATEGSLLKEEAKEFKKSEALKAALKRELDIDAYVSKLKKGIIHLPLRSQIEELEKVQPNGEVEMIGYLSLLGRLRNKLEIDDVLSPEQKQQLYGVQLKVQKAVEKLSPEELASRKQKWEKEESEASKAEFQTIMKKYDRQGAAAEALGGQPK